MERHRFITMDRLACHGDNESITALKNIGLECVYFPAHTSHFIQPLDQTPFALLKKDTSKLSLFDFQS